MTLQAVNSMTPPYLLGKVRQVPGILWQGFFWVEEIRDY